MTIDSIIQIISTILGAGGLGAFFLIVEKKTAAQLQNAEKIDAGWQKMVTQKDKDFEELSHKYEEACDKIERLYDDNSELRNRLDAANTDCAVGKIMRCDCIGCTNRIPPFGSTEKLIQSKNENR